MTDELEDYLRRVVIIDEYSEYLSNEIKLWVEDYQHGNIHGMEVASALQEAKSRYIEHAKRKLRERLE